MWGRQSLFGHQKGRANMLMFVPLPDSVIPLPEYLLTLLSIVTNSLLRTICAWYSLARTVTTYQGFR